MNLYCIPFFTALDSELETIKLANKDIIGQAYKAIEWIEQKINELYKWLKKYKFEITDEEIYFFKELKPKIISKLIYFKAVLKLESNAPIGNILKKKYFQKEYNKIHSYSKSNREFYQYYRSKSNHKDLEYFVRSSKKNIILDDCYLINYDNKLCTSNDYKVAVFMANDLLSVYFEDKLKQIVNNSKSAQPDSISTLHWTGTKIELIELIYGLAEQKVINSGNVDIIEIALTIGRLFNITIDDNLYRGFSDIKNRKALKAKFLQNMADNLNRKIDEEI